MKCPNTWFKPAAYDRTLCSVFNRKLTKHPNSFFTIFLKLWYNLQVHLNGANHSHHLPRLILSRIHLLKKSTTKWFKCKSHGWNAKMAYRLQSVPESRPKTEMGEDFGNIPIRSNVCPINPFTKILTKTYCIHYNYGLIYRKQ